MRIAILTPLSEELSLLVAELDRLGMQRKPRQFGKLNGFEFSEISLFVAQGGHGKTQFGIQAQHLFCQAPEIELLVCAGAAGALSDSLSIGDVVVATETIEHDYNLKFVSRPLPRFAGDETTIDQFRTLSPKSFSIHFGSVASGDEDVIDTARGQELTKMTGCIVVAWEGAGGARACQFNQKAFLELRGITDTANHTAAADFGVNLATAMNNLAHLNLAHLIVSWIQ